MFATAVAEPGRSAGDLVCFRLRFLISVTVVGHLFAAPVAQLDRASGFSGAAATSGQRVGGSNPSGRTIPQFLLC